MRRSELSDLAAFVTVADGLSFRAAAERLGVTASALSHTIRALEERLGVRLFHRTTRKVSLTDAGERFLARLRPAMDEISGALKDLDLDRDRPRGRLAIVGTPHAMTLTIAPVWRRYLAAYPDVQLELEVDPGPRDIVAEGFDAGVGPRYRAAGDMVAVRVSEPLRAVLAASPAYLQRRGAPRTPEDLERHDAIRLRGLQGTFIDWRLEQKDRWRKVNPIARIAVNEPGLGLRAAVDGLGITLAAEVIVEPYLRSGQLVRVLETWSLSLEGYYLYYPGRRQVPPALRALIDMIRQRA